VAVVSKHWDSFTVSVGMMLEVVQEAFYDPRREEIQEGQRKTSFQLQTDRNHTNPLQTVQSYVLRAHSNHTHVTAIFRSSSVSCWIQHRRPFVDSYIDDGTVQ